MENAAIEDHDPQVLLICEHTAEPEIAFTLWAVPVTAAAETALPPQLSLSQVLVPALPALPCDVSTQPNLDPGLHPGSCHLPTSCRIWCLMKTEGRPHRPPGSPGPCHLPSKSAQSFMALASRPVTKETLPRKQSEGSGKPGEAREWPRRQRGR